MLNTISINLKTDIKTDRPTTLPIKLMSQDKNNNQFILRFTNGGESVALDDTYTVEVLTKFAKSGASRLTSAKVRQDYATWEFDTAYITQDEGVRNYVYVRKSGNLVVSADANCFVFSVDLSEIDKGAGKVAEIYDENYQKHLDEFKDVADFTFIQQAEADRESAEIIRKSNESVRIQAEGQRESAESIRVNAEVQRQSDHANRSAELAGKADKVVLKNLIVNGDFSDGLTGWTAQTLLIDNIKVVDGKLHVYGQNSGMLTYPSISQPTYTTAGHKHYFRIEVIEMASNSLKFNLQDRNDSFLLNLSDGIHSRVITIKSGQNLTNLYLNHTIPTGGVVDYKVDSLISIDLTQTFGAGNEPTKEEMDELIKITGYIDGEYALNNKEMLIWTLSLIRRNKNAIVALGGA